MKRYEIVKSQNNMDIDQQKRIKISNYQSKRVLITLNFATNVSFHITVFCGVECFLRDVRLVGVR